MESEQEVRRRELLSGLASLGFAAIAFGATTGPASAQQNPYSMLCDGVAALEADFDKFYNKNNLASGTRAVNGMKQLKVFLDDTIAQVEARKAKLKNP